MFEELLDPILGPLLTIPSLYAIILVTFVLSLAISIVYKYTTNQKLMKQLKEEMSELQKEAKQLKDKPEEAMKVQQKAMETNMKYLMQSMRSTIFTIIPVLILFGWMTAHFAYLPIEPNTDFITKVQFDQGTAGSIGITVPDGLQVVGDSSKQIEKDEATFALKGAAGTYFAEYLFNGKTYEQKIIISEKQGDYAPVETSINKEGIKKITTSNEKNVVMDLFGWKVGWLGTYFIFSIVFSMVLRKIMNLY